MRRALAVLAALALLAGSLVGLEAWLSATAQRDLTVRAAPGPGVLTGAVRLEQAGRPRKAEVRLDGALVPLTGGALVLAPEALDPGLHTVTWSTPYLGREPRQAAFSFLAGPFGDPGVPCSVRLTLGQEVLQKLAQSLAAPLREALGGVAGLPPVQGVTIVAFVVDEGVEVGADVFFDEGSTINAQLPLVLTSSAASPVQLALRGPVTAEATGSLGAAAAIKGGGLLAGLAAILREPGRGLRGALEAAREAGRAEASAALQQQLDIRLPEVNAALAQALPARLEAAVGEVKLALELSPCGAPRSHPGRAVILAYDARPVIALAGAKAPAAAARVPGPVMRTPAGPPGPIPQGALTLAVSEDLANAALDQAWRAGALDGLLAAGNLAALNRRLARVAEVQVAEVRLDLPPVLRMTSAPRLALGEAKVVLRSEAEGDAEVSLLLEAGLGAKLAEGHLALRAHDLGVLASCTEEVPGGVLRGPCFPEFFEELDRELAARGALTRSLPLSAGEGRVRVHLEEVTPEEGWLRLRAGLELTP